MSKLKSVLIFGRDKMILKKYNMKQITIKEVREIAKDIVSKTSKSVDNSQAIEGVELMLVSVFEEMKIEVEGAKKDPNCKCKNCGCK